MTDTYLRDSVRDLGARAETLRLAADEWMRGDGSIDAVDVAVCDLDLTMHGYVHYRDDGTVKVRRAAEAADALGTAAWDTREECADAVTS